MSTFRKFSQEKWSDLPRCLVDNRGCIFFYRRKCKQVEPNLGNKILCSYREKKEEK